MKLFLNFFASYPVIFLSAFVVTTRLFMTLDILTAGIRRSSLILRLLLASVNGVVACGYLALAGKYNPNSLNLLLVLLIVLVGTLAHTLLGQDNADSYSLMGGCCLLNALAAYQMVYSVYRLMPFDFDQYGGAICQRVVCSVTCVCLSFMVSVFRAGWFPGRELNVAIHEKQYSMLQHIWFPATNAILLFCGGLILPLAQVADMSRNVEVYFHAVLLAWGASSLLSCYIILFVQGRQIRWSESQQMELAHERERSDELKTLADQHPLTGLLNHRAWSLQVRADLERMPGGAVIMLDLDHFKQVNDTWGHQEGDRVLLETAQLLRRNFRSTDPAGHVVGHVGGDEFCIFLAGQIPMDAIARRMDELLGQSGAQYGTGEEAQRVTFSAGVAVFPEHGGTLEELVHHADEALYYVKAKGGNAWAMWREDD